MSVMFNSLPFLWQGLLVTLHVSTLVVVIALGCGVLLGLGLSFGPRWTAWPIRIYSDVIRGLPLLVLIFSIYYMLPLTGWNVSNFWAAVSALAAFQTAHVVEVTRGAVQSIPSGQHEAGKSIGLTFAQRMFYVVFPQALRRFLPPWINTVVATVQGSALDSLPIELSGGQQQRVGIARAVAMNPKVLLLDEITSALDPELVGEVLNVVHSLARDGMTMILVTHEMSFARDVSSQVVFMDGGRVAVHGTPQDVFAARTQHERLRSFLARIELKDV